MTGWNQTLPGPAAQRRIRDRRDHPGRAAAVPGRPAAGTSAQRPLPGGLRLVATSPSNGERRFILSDEGGRVVRAWRVTGKDDLGAGVATPALVGGDPVVVVGISRETKKEFLYEFEVLRLARTGGASVRFAIGNDRVVWGDTPITGVRVGRLQLRTPGRQAAHLATPSADRRC